MTTGIVYFHNKIGHAIEARRLPTITDFEEDDLEKTDETWLKSYITVKDINDIQLYATSKYILYMGTQGQHASADVPLLCKLLDEIPSKAHLGRSTMQC